MDRSNLYNVIHLSLSFILIFMSFSVAQTFQTSSDHAKNGAFAVSIIYLVFCLANLTLSSYITRLIGLKLTLILSGLTYVLFIAANIKYQIWMLYISAFLLGIGAALLWTAQGVYVAVSISKHERTNSLVPSSSHGFINGLFFGLFQSHPIIANLLVSFLFRWNYPQRIIFTIMTGIAALGVFTLIFLRPIKIPKDTKQRSIMGSLSMVMEIPFLLLLPTICYSGLSQGFIYGTIPPLIINKSAKFLLFAFYGFISACSSIIFGKLSDYLGRRLLIFAIGALVHMIIFGLLLIVWTPPIDENRFDIFVIIIVCLSMGDAIYTTQFYAVLSILYGETRPTDAFACMKAFQAGFTAISFIEQVYVPFSVQILCLIIVLSLSLITLIYEHYAIISLNTGKTIMSMENQNQNKVETEQEAKIPLATLIIVSKSWYIEKIMFEKNLLVVVYS